MSFRFEFSYDHLVSAAFPQTSRAFLAQEIPANIDYMQVNRTSASVSYDFRSCLTWIYESLWPSDFSYKHEAKHEYILLTAPFWPLDDETIFRVAQETLDKRHHVTQNDPVHRVCSIFLHFCNAGRFAELCPRLLELLNQVSTDDSAEVIVPAWSQGFNEGLQLQLRRNFSTHLFVWDDLRCPKLEEWDLSPCLRILNRHLTAIVTAFAHSFIPFVTAASDVPFVL
ncbi:hypothetical protein F5I97DRAFT_1829655 [Phlebopus sp. FC_14]|nr:hypothetical protein F5I97DRAFT_1829655 [Phlebopus sp. FC_14]